MKRPGTRLNVECINQLIAAGTTDADIISHYRALHFDIKQVMQMIKRCKMKILIADKVIPRTIAPIDPRQDWGMRVWRKGEP